MYPARVNILSALKTNGVYLTPEGWPSASDKTELGVAFNSLINEGAVHPKGVNKQGFMEWVLVEGSKES